MENPHVNAIFGMHLIPDEKEIGTVEFHEGPLTTSVDLFDITVIGKGGHGSTPHLTKDPILAACQMVTLLQQIPARYIDPSGDGNIPCMQFSQRRSSKRHTRRGQVRRHSLFLSAFSQKTSRRTSISDS